MAAATSENFTTAAETLHITQPLVSRTVTQLEEEFGFPLFARENRKVRLTPSGRILLEHFSNITSYICHAVELAQAAYRGSGAVLSIADNRDTDKSKYFQPIIQKFMKEYPEVQLRIAESDSGYSVPGIASNNVDVAFTVSGELPRLHNSNLKHEHFRPVPACLCVGPDSPFYDRQQLEMRELEGVPILLIDYSESCNYNEYINGLFGSYGMKPIVHTYVPNTASLLHMVGKIPGVGVISNEYFNIGVYPEVRAIPIRDTSCELIIFYNETNTNPYVDRFLKAAREYFNEEGSGTRSELDKK